jgi:hypothetical protein
MSQQQPSSLPHWRTRQREVGADRALREAASELDRLVDEIGRKTDAHLTVMLGSLLWGLVLGFLIGRFLLPRII